MLHHLKGLKSWSRWAMPPHHTATIWFACRVDQAKAHTLNASPCLRLRLAYRNMLPSYQTTQGRRPGCWMTFGVLSQSLTHHLLRTIRHSACHSRFAKAHIAVGNSTKGCLPSFREMPTTLRLLDWETMMEMSCLHLAQSWQCVESRLVWEEWSMEL